MIYADIHIHALFGVDDGAKTEAEMYAIVDASYADGVRALCCTPHYHPGYFGDNREKTNGAFLLLEQYVRGKYPNMALLLGNELRYDHSCLSWLEERACRTLGETRCVLVDFLESEERQTIVRGMERLLNAGYLPVLAHAERYRNMDLQALGVLRDKGVVMQLDAQSITGSFGLSSQRRSRKLLSAHLADLVSSDAHDLKRRLPGLSRCHAYLAKHWGKDYADALCKTNALCLLSGSANGKD